MPFSQTSAIGAKTHKREGNRNRPLPPPIAMLATGRVNGTARRWCRSSTTPQWLDWLVRLGWVSEVKAADRCAVGRAIGYCPDPLGCPHGTGWAASSAG